MIEIKNVAILGSTGSVGANTLKVVESLKRRFRVIALSSYSNIELLAEQIKRFKPSMACVVESGKAKELKKRIGVSKTKIFSAQEGLNIIAASADVDIVVIAISGSAAIYPLLSAIKKSKHICLSNKESIVMAGCIIIKEAERHNASLIPVDSEHSAIFQCINSSTQPAKINRIYLTGSGGPLYKVAKSKFSSLKVEQVLKHPKWNMGKKITVDSATLMNKGLEMIEAKYLFDISVDKIKILIHPEAIIHSMVEFIDGAILAHLGITDMRLPIQYALTYPERVKGLLSKLDFLKIKRLSFCKPDTAKYPLLDLAIYAATSEGTYPAVLNAADEEAVKAFLKGKISFVKIADIMEKVLTKHRSVKKPCLDDILKADAWAREEVFSIC